jgi:hypothetical protein
MVTHASWLKRQTGRFKREGATNGNGRSDGRQVSRPLSRFPYDMCLAHGVRKQEAGEPIRSVGGLANHFYWTGKEDEEIARGLGSDDARYARGYP